MAINITKNEQYMLVEGTFNEMKPYISQLKSKGFKWDALKKYWYIELKKLTPLKEKNIQKMFVKQEELEQENKMIVDDILNDFVKKNKFKHLSLIKTHNGMRISSSFNMYEYSNTFYQLGFVWNRQLSCYECTDNSLKVEKIDDLKNQLEKIENNFEKMNKEQERNKNELKKLDGTTIDGVIKFKVQGDTIFIGSPDKIYRDIIKKYFPNSSWQSPNWVVSMKNVSSFSLDNFEKDVQKINKDNMVQKYDYVISKGSGYGGKPFKVGQIIKNPNKGSNEPQYLYVVKESSKYFHYDGMTFGVGEERGYIYRAYCREATYEEYKHLIEKEQQRMNKKELENRLLGVKNIVIKEGLSPRVSPNKKINPQGDMYIIGGKNTIMYGGGEWFILSNDNKSICYVKNNGGDGDDWSKNNISTGGAGGIGWFLRDQNLYEELKEILKQLNIKKE